MAVRIPRYHGTAWGGALPAPVAPIATPMAPGPAFVLGLGVNVVLAMILRAQKRDLHPVAQRFADVAPPLQAPDPDLATLPEGLIELLELEIERLKRSDDPFDQSHARVLRGIIESLQLALGMPTSAQKDAVDPHTIVNSASPGGSASTVTMETAEATDNDVPSPPPVYGRALLEERIILILARRPVERHLDHIVKHAPLLFGDGFLPEDLSLIEILEDLGKEVLRSLAGITDHRIFMENLAEKLSSKGWEQYADQIIAVLSRKHERISAVPEWRYHAGMETCESGAHSPLPCGRRRTKVTFRGLKQRIAAEYIPLQTSDPFDSSSALIAWAVAHQEAITAQFGNDSTLDGSLKIGLGTIVSAVFKARKIRVNESSIVALSNQVATAIRYWAGIDQKMLEKSGTIPSYASTLRGSWFSDRPTPKPLETFTIMAVLWVARRIYNGGIIIPGLTKGTSEDSRLPTR